MISGLNAAGILNIIPNPRPVWKRIFPKPSAVEKVEIPLFRGFLKGSLRLWRGQPPLQRKPCSASAFAASAYMPPEPNQASGDCGPRTPQRVCRQAETRYFPPQGLTRRFRGAIMALLQGVVKFHTGGEAASRQRECRQVRERRESAAEPVRIRYRRYSPDGRSWFAYGLF